MKWTDPKLATGAPLLNGYLRSLVEQENFAQLRKWGVQSHSPAEWGLLVSEEFGEMMKDLCDLHFARDNLTAYESRAKFVAEAIQTITLLAKMVRMAEEGL